MRRTPAIVRSRLGPYLRVTTRFLPFSPSSTAQPATKPSCCRISAMCTLILEWGIVTESWYAWFALRTRVSMSAIGSVMVMGRRPFLAVVPVQGLRRSGGARVVQGLVQVVRVEQATLRGYLDPGTGTSYQELLVTPGSSPACAISRTQT